MLQEIPNLRAWRRKHEGRSRACGLIPIRYRRGSGERGIVRRSNHPHLFLPMCSAHRVSKTSLMVESGEVDFSRPLTYPSACSKNKPYWCTSLVTATPTRMAFGEEKL
jgi:hypothetical protein